MASFPYHDHSPITTLFLGNTVFYLQYQMLWQSVGAALPDTTILVEEGILHAVRLKRKNITRKKKEIATAIYLYQVDYDGEWCEIYFDFVNRTTEIRKLAEWDRMISKVFSKKAICYIQTHPLLVNLKEIVISFSL